MARTPKTALAKPEPKLGVVARLSEKSADLLARVVTAWNGRDQPMRSVEDWIEFHLRRDAMALDISAGTAAAAPSFGPASDRVFGIAARVERARRDRCYFSLGLSWDEWSRRELGIAGSYALALTDLARNFTRADVERCGIARLLPLLRVVGDRRDELLAVAPTVTTRVLAGLVSAETSAKRVTGRRQTPSGLRRAA